MGNSQTQNVQQQIFHSTHPNFKDAKIVTDKHSRTIQAKFKIQNKQFDQWEKSLNDVKTKIKSQYLLLPQKINFKHDPGLCGNTGTLIANYPYHPYLLSELIKQRQTDNKLFKESELWYVLYSLANIKHSFEQSSYNQVGDIKPENIFVNEYGIVKIVNVFSWPNEQTSFIKSIDKEVSSFSGLLAPEDVALIAKGALDNQQNTQSEIFAIGATILSLGILQNLDSIYNHKEQSFNQIAFKETRRLWAQTQKYSNIFKSLVLNLSNPNPADRLTSKQLWEWVSQYSENILNKEQFVINNAPTKIERSFKALLEKTY